MEERIIDLKLDLAKLTADAVEWASDVMLTYIYLKDFEKYLKNALMKLWDIVFSQLENYDLNDLPMWYTGRVQTRLTVDYNSVPEYKEQKEKLTNYEKLLKQAVDLSLRNQTLNDEDWVLVPVPEYTQSSSFVLTKKRK